MSPSEDDKPDNALGDKLEELESLLDKDEISPKPEAIKVPVLDELVTEADYINSEGKNDLEQIEEEITDLAEKLEQKFSGELDQLVRLLKDNLKHSIVEELRTQANLNQDEPDTEEGSDNGTIKEP